MITVVSNELTMGHKNKHIIEEIQLQYTECILNPEIYVNYE
jgi:hypothetical protein